MWVSICIWHSRPAQRNSTFGRKSGRNVHSQLPNGNECWLNKKPTTTNCGQEWESPPLTPAAVSFITPTAPDASSAIRSMDAAAKLVQTCQRSDDQCHERN